MSSNLGKSLGYVPRLGNVPPMGYVPRLGNSDMLSAIDWEENKWTYVAGMAAVGLIIVAMLAKKRKRSRVLYAAPPAQPTPGV